MKRTILILAAVAVSLLILAGCAPTVPAFSASLGGSQASETTALNSALSSLQLRNTNAAGTLTPLTVVGTAGSIKNTTNQVFTITFNAAVDASTIAGAVSFNALTAGSAFVPNTKTALTYTSVVNGKDVIFTINATSATATCLLVIDATKLTANNGAIKLDLNTNGIQGETEDSYYATFTVTTNSAAGATAPAAVATLSTEAPQSTATFTATGLLASASTSLDIATYTGANILTFTLQDTGSSATTSAFATDLSSAISVFKNVAGVWTAVAFTAPAVVSTRPATATITLTTAPAVGETYKVVVNRYNLVENAAVLGYTHRVSWDKNNTGGARDYIRYYNFTNAGGAYQNLTTGGSAITTGFPTAGTNYGPYIDIAIAGGKLPIDVSTISSATVLVKLAALTPLSTGTAPQEFLSSYTLVSLETSSATNLSDTAIRHFRLYLPSTVKSLLTVGTPNRLMIAPTVLSPADTTTVANSLNSFGAAANGWATYNF